MLSDEENVRLYGPWRQHNPVDAAELLTGYSGRWWIAGGFAIEAFTGIQRSHVDLDIGVPRPDVALVSQHLNSCLDVWAADEGALHPLLGELNESIPSTCGNLWTRRSGADPWEYDIILMDTSISSVHTNGINV